MKNTSTTKITLTLAPMVIALAWAMDVYVPAIPELTNIFQASDNMMLLTLSVFMFTAGIMQLAVGPLADSYGRRTIGFFVVFIFALGCILCAYSINVYALIAARMIQAVGACGMLVLGFTIVRDCFVGDESAKVYSYLNGIIAFSPMFAPFVGSYLDIYFGWRTTFLFLLLIALMAMISLKYFFQETLPVTKREKMSFAHIVADYKKIIKNPHFLVYNMATCFGLSYLYLFCALSPYLIIRQIGIDEASYGFYFFYMGVSFFIGSIFCSQIVMRFGVYKTCLLGFLITLFGSIWMALWHFHNGLTLEGFIYPMLLIGIGGTICMGAGSGGMMEPFGENTGSASALGGTMRFMFSSLVGIAVIRDNVASTLPLGLPGILFSVIGIFIFVLFKPKNVLA